MTRIGKAAATMILLAVAQSAAAQVVPGPQSPTSPPQGWAAKSGLLTLAPGQPVGPPQQAIDRLMIHETFDRWAVAFDEGQFDVIGSLFTPDGECLFTRSSATPVLRVTGPDAIMKVARSAFANQTDQRRHVISNVIIDALTPTEARAIAYGVVTVAADGLTLGTTSVYVARLRKGTDNVWRFSRFTAGVDHYEGTMMQSGK